MNVYERQIFNWHFHLPLESVNKERYTNLKEIYCILMMADKVAYTIKRGPNIFFILNLF